MRMGAKGGGSSVERIALAIKLQGKSPRDDREQNYNFFTFFFFAVLIWKWKLLPSKFLEKRKSIDIVDRLTCSAVVLVCNTLGKDHEICMC